MTAHRKLSGDRARVPVTEAFPLPPVPTTVPNGGDRQIITANVSGPTNGSVGDRMTFTGAARWSAERPDHSGFCVNDSQLPCDIGTRSTGCPSLISIPPRAGSLAVQTTRTFSEPGTYVVHFELYTGCEYWLGSFTNASMEVTIR